MLACPHSVSLVRPVPASEEDVLHCLASVAALTLVSVGLVDGVEVSAQADLAGAHLRNDRADRSVCAYMGGEEPFSGPDSESEELSAVFGRFPTLCPFVSHCLTDGRFHGCHKVSR